MSAAGPEAAAAGEGPLLSIENLVKVFPGRRSALGSRGAPVTAVDDVSLEIRRGETFGVVGETGSGKSTLGRLALRLLEPTAGRIVFGGRDVSRLGEGRMRPLRRKMQMVFQDPYGSLDPRMKVVDIVAEPMHVHGIDRAAIGPRIADILDLVGLSPAMADRYPHEFSGGQRQRIGIARAIALDPELLVLDEPVSALDVSIQAQILNLLADIQKRTGLSYMFIAHDLAVVRHISDRIAVMYLGRVVETAPRERLYAHPRHPYTAALLSAVPLPDRRRERARRRIPLHGEIGSGTAIPTGCRFHPRCFKARRMVEEGRVSAVSAAGTRLPRLCVERDPLLTEDRAGSAVACHFPLEPGEADAVAPVAPAAQTMETSR